MPATERLYLPVGGGGMELLVEIATTIHHGIVFVFASQNQNPTATTSTDRAAFGKFLAGIRLQR